MSWRTNAADALRPMAQPKGSPWSEIVHGYPVATWVLMALIAGILFVMFVMTIDEATGGNRATRRRARVIFVLWLVLAGLYAWQINRMI